jgi:hypothetical protein
VNSPKMLEVIDATRTAMGMTRADMALKMEEESGEAWDKEKLDKVLTARSMPRVETLFLMLKVLRMPCWPWEWCQATREAKSHE